MNENNFYYNSVYETPEEREDKKRRQRKFFSRVFIALFVYLLSFNLIGSGIFVIANLILSPEKYEAFANNSTAVVLVSSIAQYAIAFPIFLLITKGMVRSENRKKKKLSIGDGIVLFAIAELLMFIGNLIGTLLNASIGALIGEMPENGIDQIVENTPIWLIFIIMVVIAPIVEEIIFRRVMIDRLSIYGDHVAIIFSSVAFGLMHGNLYQLFYATLLGALLGYVYTVTRDVRYTIVIHAIINFLGSIVVLVVMRAGDYAALITSNEVLIALISELASSFYNAFQSGLIIAGAIALVYKRQRREIRISTDTEIYVPMRDTVKGGILNTGSILFILISVALMVLNSF